MLALCLMLSGTYYAKNYAGIIGRGLMGMRAHVCVCVYVCVHVHTHVYVTMCELCVAILAVYMPNNTCTQC